MLPSRVSLSVGLLVGLALLAGCGSLFDGDGSSQSTTTVTPVPVAEVTEAATSTPEDDDVNGGSRTDTNRSAAVQHRYSSLRPTCERPPGLVIHIQVGALGNNDPETDAGINTTWRFAAPSNRQQTGPNANFAEMIKTFYRPLLDSESVEYGPMQKSENTGRRLVTVTNATGASTTYDWRVEKQTVGEYEGCWMTTAVQEVD